MAYGYRVVDREQPFLLPPDMRDWLPPGHLAWFVIDAVSVLDVSRFAPRATPAGSAAGRAAYDPRMLLALLVYGYARGLRSSRKIERACTEDVAFRVICAQDGPDHATLARFRRQHFADPDAMADLFAQVLAIAARAGLGRLGLVAVDGTKIAASASKDANRTEAKLAELAAEILAEAEEADAAEDVLFGDARDDELPAGLADPPPGGSGSPRRRRSCRPSCRPPRRRRTRGPLSTWTRPRPGAGRAVMCRPALMSPPRSCGWIRHWPRSRRTGAAARRRYSLSRPRVRLGHTAPC